MGQILSDVETETHFGQVHVVGKVDGQEVIRIYYGCVQSASALPEDTALARRYASAFTRAIKEYRRLEALGKV
jgi:hypothetical protein